jgi:hypothetical protein
MLKTSQTAILAAICLCLPAGALAGPFDGLTLYTTIGSRTSNLINNSGQTVHSWSASYNCAYMCYLTPDSLLWRGDVYSGATMRGAAYGGRMQAYDWNGNIVHSFIWSNSYHQQHHDHHPMPNGNVLLVSWDRKTRAEAQALGRVNISGDIWPDEVIEYDPVADSVVWEWHFWDHLIQDVDSTKPNYGVVREHPELLDINLGTVMSGDWIHCNTVDYNAERDEVILTSHNLHELYVIDHSTTTEEARGHAGGRRGRGGDFLYRWGNPQNYDRGTSSDRVFYVVHGGNWIRPGFPGEGDILILNNGDRSGSSNDYSVATQITPPLDSLGNYCIHPDSAFGPRVPTWSYGAPGLGFYSQHLGGAYRLADGNTLAVLGTSGTLKEITPDGQIAWTRSVGGQLGRAFKFSSPVSGVESREQAPWGDVRLTAMPSPFTGSMVIQYVLPVAGPVRISVSDLTGRVIRVLADGAQTAGQHSVGFAPGRGLAAGVYVVLLETDKQAGSSGYSVRTLAVVKGE